MATTEYRLAGDRWDRTFGLLIDNPLTEIEDRRDEFPDYVNVRVQSREVTDWVDGTEPHPTPPERQRDRLLEATRAIRHAPDSRGHYEALRALYDTAAAIEKEAGK